MLPGHGHPIPGEEAPSRLRGVERHAAALAGIAEMNARRAAEVAAYAEQCMAQVNDLFHVIAGRLLCVAYLLEELGERDEARALDTLADTAAIDALLDTFRGFAAAWEAGRERPHVLALKAGQVMDRLGQVFDPQALSRLVPATWLDRAERLLADYAHMLRGYLPPAWRREYDIGALLAAVAARHRTPGCPDAEVLRATEAADRFVAMLEARAGTRPLLESVAVTVEVPSAPVTADLDRERFEDLLAYLLEDLVAAGARRIDLALAAEASGAVVAVAGTPMRHRATCEQTPSAFLSGLAGRTGGTLALDDEPERRRYAITLSCAA